MKRKILKILTFCLVFLIIYVSFGIFGIFQVNKNNKFLFTTKEKLEFHKKYSDKMHHLRDSNRWGETENSYLFSVINFNNTNSKTILFQGDSWIESISEIKKSNDLLKKFGEDKKYNIYNSGITSFAPSLMHVQHKILKKDFKIKPNKLVIYIDQTDIGDEFCRYSHNKIYKKNGELDRVKSEKFNKAVFDYTKTYQYSELNFSGKLITILKYPAIKSEYFIKRNIFQVKQIYQNGLKNRNFKKCSFREIEKVLLRNNLKAEKSFKKSLKEYLDFLLLESKIKNIIIVSFPHLNHHKKKYTVNVSDYIDQVLDSHSDDRIEHLNMGNLSYIKENYSKIYKKDLASHLKGKYHTNLFMREIISKIR